MSANSNNESSSRKPAVTFQAPKRVTAGEDEWVVIARDEDGKRIEAECYYTGDLEDAKQTRAHMQQRVDEIAEAAALGPCIIGKTCTATDHRGCGAPRGFRPFTKHDWMAFGGCETERPFIADITIGDDDIVAILDGSCVQAHHADGHSWGHVFTSNEQAQLIAELLVDGVEVTRVLEAI